MLQSVRILAPGKPAAAAVSGTAGTEAGIFSVHCVLPTLIFITTLEWNRVNREWQSILLCFFTGAAQILCVCV